MRNSVPKNLWIAVAVTAAWTSAAGAAELAGVKLDDTVNVGGTALVLNGAGLRTKFGAKVYVAGLYVPAKSADAASIFAGTGPRKMKLVMKRNVSADTMWGAFREGIEANSTPSELKALQPKLEKMEKAFNALGKTAEGDVLEFDFAADGTTAFSVNGQAKETIPGQDLSTAFLKIWLGAKPAQEPLKKALLGG